MQIIISKTNTIYWLFFWGKFLWLTKFTFIKVSRYWRSQAVKFGKIVCGGGAVEIELAGRLKRFSRTLSGREQLVVEEFANSLDSIPETLAENAGLDSINILTELKKRYEQGNSRDGLNLFNGKIEDVYNIGIVEPLKVKTQAIMSATEVATLILRVDDVLISSKKKDLIKEID